MYKGELNSKLKIEDSTLLGLMEGLKKKNINDFFIAISSLKDQDVLNKKLMNDLLVKNVLFQIKLSMVIKDKEDIEIFNTFVQHVLLKREENGFL
jgi:hypothetical protein